MSDRLRVPAHTLVCEARLPQTCIVSFAVPLFDVSAVIESMHLKHPYIKLSPLTFPRKDGAFRELNRFLHAARIEDLMAARGKERKVELSVWNRTHASGNTYAHLDLQLVDDVVQVTHVFDIMTQARFATEYDNNRRWIPVELIQFPQHALVLAPITVSRKVPAQKPHVVPNVTPPPAQSFSVFADAMTRAGLGR